MGDISLRYDGAGSLHFRDGTGARRAVASGSNFTADEATARTLVDSDPRVRITADVLRTSMGGSLGPAPSVAPTASAQAMEPEEEISGTNGELREQLAVAGLSTKGNKDQLTDRLAAFRAGVRSAGAVGAVASTNPLVEDPASSEAEPLAPAPPEGGSLPVPGATVMAVVPPEQPGTGSAPGAGTGAVTLGDIPASGKVK